MQMNSCFVRIILNNAGCLGIVLLLRQTFEKMQIYSRYNPTYKALPSSTISFYKILQDLLDFYELAFVFLYI